MLKKIIVVVVLAVMSFTAVLAFGGCGYPRKAFGAVWTYYILQDNTIALVGMNPKAVPKDGILYIPNTVDGRKVSGFGVITGSYGGQSVGTMFDIPQRMQRTTVAEGIPIQNNFWGTGGSGRVTELESKTAENIYFGSTGKCLIVPDGCLDIYVAAMERQRAGLSKTHTLLEKSKVVDWYVDDDGLLLGYYGLEPDHYVLPSGIKKINSVSFQKNSPKTIILNEDLEEIGSYGISRFGLDELRTRVHGFDNVSEMC